MTTPAANQRSSRRGLRGNRSPSQQALSVSQRAMNTSGYLDKKSLLSHSKSPEPSVQEPQFLASTSTRSLLATPAAAGLARRGSVGSVSILNGSRRGSINSTSILNGSRRGLRHKNHDALVRRVSVSSFEMQTGSGHTGSGHSNKSNMDVVVETSRPGLSREVSDLNDSTTSFFGDDMNSSELSHNDLNALQESRRTFEDMSLEAQIMADNKEDEAYEMEISPGVYLPFRGSQETWRAVNDGSALESTCLECGIQLVSVPDCQCVVCPDCKMVNPIFDHPAGTQEVHGVGMGFQKEWIDKRRQSQSQDFSRRN